MLDTISSTTLFEFDLDKNSFAIKDCISSSTGDISVDMNSSFLNSSK